MTTFTSTEKKSLLQQGIAAARSGRSAEALQILERVVQIEPENEMAWLWLSGLMRSNQEKRACLENVLKANPENVYARAGLTRLQDTSPMAPDELEARLAFAMGENNPPTSSAGALGDKPPAKRRSLKRLRPPRSANQKRNGNSQAAPTIRVADSVEPTSELEPESDNPAVPEALEPICPACDEPISPTAKMCPFCFMPLRSMEELLDLDAQNQESGTTHASRRGRILGSLGSVISH